jgi:hypothetical protein
MPKVKRAFNTLNLQHDFTYWIEFHKVTSSSCDDSFSVFSYVCA